MASATSPDGLPVPAPTDTVQPNVDIAALSNATQTALSSRAIHNYRWATATERSAQAGMSKGDYGYQADTDSLYRYDGSSWVALAATGLDTGWVDLATSSSFTGSPSLRYRAKNGWVQLYVDGFISTTSGTTYTLTASGVSIPTAYRPRGTTRTGGYFSGYPGTVSALSDGTVIAIQNTGATRTSVSAAPLWPIEGLG